MGRSGCSPQVLVDSRGPKVCDDLREFCGFRGSSLVLEYSGFGRFSRSPPVLGRFGGVLQFCPFLEYSSFAFSGVLQFALVALFALLVGFTVLGWVLDYQGFSRFSRSPPVLGRFGRVLRFWLILEESPSFCVVLEEFPGFWLVLGG